MFCIAQDYDINLLRYAFLNASSEKKIVEQHREAVQNLCFTYDDPETGLKVITRLRHFLKGSCCGNACRHCIYNHEAVSQEKLKERVFNSAFWKNTDE